MARQMQSTPVSGTFDGGLKHWYEEPVKSMLSELFPWYDYLKKNGRINRNPKVRGDYIYFNTTVKRSSAVQASGEMDLLPTIDQVDSVQGYLPYMKGFKGRIGVSHESMRYGKKGEGSFVDLVEQEFEEMMNGFKESGSVAFWGDGYGTCGLAASTSTTMMTITSTEEYDTCQPGTRWLHEGKKYLPVGAILGTYEMDATFTTPVEISSIDSDTQVTLAASRTQTTASQHLVEADTASNTSVGDVLNNTAEGYRGPMGLSAMIDDGNIYSGDYANISHSTYPRWKANALDNSGTLRALTMKLFYQCFFKTARKTGKMKPNVTCWMSPDMLLELVDLLEHFVEFKPRKMEGGFEEVDVMINGQLIKIKLDFYCPGYIFFVCDDEIDFYETIPLEIADDHGSEWIPYANQDALEARLRWNWQLGTKKRNAHGVIRDINYTVSTV